MDTGAGITGGSASRVVIGVFRSMDDAQRAFDRLVREGYSNDEISLVANKAGVEGSRQSTDKAGSVEHTAKPKGSTESEVATDAGIGAAIGGVGALLLSLAIPGIGPVLAAGPILAALGGAGLGAAAGSLIGALTEHGIPEELARNYAEGVRRGDVLVAVHASGERADAASRILDESGAVSIDDRVSNWRQRGWSGYDESAEPLTEDELRREREYYNAANFEADRTAAGSEAGRTTASESTRTSTANEAGRTTTATEAGRTTTATEAGRTAAATPEPATRSNTRRNR
jgi:hypothetical protein